MRLKNILKGSLISLAILGMIGGSINPANAKRRRYHYRTSRKARRSVNRYGYWRKYRRHGRTHYSWCRYRTGYFHNGHWVKYQTKRTRHYAKRTSNHERTYKLEGLSFELPSYSAYKKAERGLKNGSLLITYHHGKNILSTPRSLRKYDYYHPKKHAKHTKHTKHVNHPTNADINTNLAEMKSQTLTDINNDRQANGVAPLTESTELDNIANMRAQQLNYYLEHKDPNTGINYYAEDAQQLGYSNIPNKSLSENITQATLGKSAQTRDPRMYNNHNGYDMANEDEDAMMNYDGPSWGHRENILDPTNTNVGIGTAYRNGTYSLSEDFTGPDSVPDLQ